MESVTTAETFAFRDRNKNGRLDPYEDPRRPVEERVEDLLAQMTLEEKAGLLFQAMVPLETGHGSPPGLTPAFCNIAACARDPARSWAARRLSKPMETLIACISSAGFVENRPPHMAWPLWACPLWACPVWAWPSPAGVFEASEEESVI